MHWNEVTQIFQQAHASVSIHLQIDNWETGQCIKDAVAVDVTYERDCLDISRWRLTRIEKGDTSYMRVWKVEKKGMNFFK